MDIVCFGQQNWDYCWTGKQQLMSRLAGRGHRVLYVDPTWVGVGGAVAEVDTPPGLRRVGPGELYVYTYGYRPLLRWRGNRWWRPRALRRVVDGLGFREPAGLALRPPALPLLDALDLRGRVYYAVDEMTAFGDRAAAAKRSVRAEEEAMLAAVDVAIGVSRRLTRRFATLHPRSRFLSNGADVEHFAPESLAAAAPHPALPAASTGPTLAFVGQVDERLDQPLLVSLAEELPGARIVLAGRVKPGVDVSRLEAVPGVRLLGYVPYEDLPRVLTAADVCLVPYEVNELTRSCNPLKVFEYLATGRPVVATRLDGLEWCEDVIAIADDASAFRAAVREALADPARGRQARLARARANGWDARVDELQEILREARALHDVRAAVRAAPPDPRYVGGGLGPAGAAVHAASRLAGRLLSLGRALPDLARGRRPRPRRVLVARRTRLGDMVVFLPTLRALRALAPEARVVLAVQRGAGAMASRLARDVVDEIRELDFLAAPTRAARLRGAWSLLTEGFDLLVTGAAYATLQEALLCGAPRWIGLDERHPLHRLAPERVPLDPQRHEAANHLALAEAAGAVAVGPGRCPWVRDPGPEARRAVREAIGPRAGDGRFELVIAHPGAQKPSRRWSVGSWATLIEGLLDGAPTRRVVVTGGRDERELAASVRAGVSAALRERCVVTAGETDLDGLIATLATADLVVCGDTGVLHLARALGTPLLALLGPENEDRWGPHPGGPGPAVSLRHEVPCAPCKRWECGPHFCLESLAPGEALAAARELLDGDRAAERGDGVEFPAWATGYGENVPAAEADGPRILHPLDRRTRVRGWAAIEPPAPPAPQVVVLGAAGSGAPSARQPVDYPESRLGEAPEGIGHAFAVALLADPGAWGEGRLSAEVGFLVRRPDLGMAGPAGAIRNPGDPLPVGAERAGLTFRAAVVEELLAGRGESALVDPAEYAVVRAAWQVVARRSLAVSAGTAGGLAAEQATDEAAAQE